MGEHKELPVYLYRVTDEPQFDEEGYLVPHAQGLGLYPDQRSIPMVHPDEWEGVARFLFYFKILSDTAPFAVLTILTSKVEQISVKEHLLLEHGEFHGHVPREAIIEIATGRWIDGQELPSVSDKFAKNELGKQILSYRSWTKPVIDK